MFAGLKHQLRTSKYRLCSKFVCLCSRHSICNCCIRHCLKEHKNICRGTSGNTYHYVHQTFRNHFCLSEGIAEFYCQCCLFLCHQIIHTKSCHAFSDHRRCIWHCTDNLCLLAQLVCKPLESFARCDRNKNLIFFYAGFDLIQNTFQELRFHCQKYYIGKFHNLCVRIRLLNTKFFLNLFAGFV